MINIRKLTMLLIAALVLAGLTNSVALAQDPDNGKVLWEQTVWQCQNCHGAEGQGNWGPPLAGSQKTAQEWITQVRTPRRAMPMFSEQQVSDEQLTDMHAYIASLPQATDYTRPDAGLPPDAPAGQQLIVEKRCVACHSTTGPIKGFIDRGEMPTAMAVINQLRNPRMNMPTFDTNHVSDEEATLIAEFMAQEFGEQAAPATLPQSGHETGAFTWPLTLLLIGLGLLLTGFILRRSLTRGFR